MISLGWLTWMFIHSGWYFCEHVAEFRGDALGMKTGTRLPMRMISMCGISRRRRSSSSSSLGARVSGSPPESSTSRTWGVCLRYSICISNSLREKVALGSPTMRERVQ